MDKPVRTEKKRTRSKCRVLLDTGNPRNPQERQERPPSAAWDEKAGHSERSGR